MACHGIFFVKRWALCHFNGMVQGLMGEIAQVLLGGVLEQARLTDILEGKLL